MNSIVNINKYKFARQLDRIAKLLIRLNELSKQIDGEISNGNDPRKN